MPSNNVFRWLDGAGWMIFSGGATDDDTIRAQALGKLAADGGVAYVTLSGDAESGERALEDMEDLGAPSGYIVDVTTEDDASIRQKLAEAGMVVIESGRSADAVRSSLFGAGIDGIQVAYENGAVVLAEGNSAMVFGAWVTMESGELKDGFEWLTSALIAPGVTNAAEWAKDLLQSQPSAFAVGIGAGSALGLGSAGEIEIWGDGQVTVALGAQYTMSDGGNNNQP
jgi:hypothetical protein